MEDKQLRNRINKIRDSIKGITEEINLIYNENAESEEKIVKIKKIIHNTENRPIEFADSLNKIKDIINNTGA
ncbi:hypothetical protein HY498_05120 [Candidatus Woesearchaeota archaeon]|nr:hypothetical protein [Candidatus Woesearchaeota archaeon]